MVYLPASSSTWMLILMDRTLEAAVGRSCMTLTLFFTEAQYKEPHYMQ